jgi:hypothetical protein
LISKNKHLIGVVSLEVSEIQKPNIKAAWIFITIVLSLFGCNKQIKKELLSIEEKMKVTKRADNQPKVSWNAKKVVDKKEKSYVMIPRLHIPYKNLHGDSIWAEVDSFVKSFNNYFSMYLSRVWDRTFMQDSIFQHDFFNDDYFYNRWENDIFNMKEMFRQMDLSLAFYLFSYWSFQKKKQLF